MLNILDVYGFSSAERIIAEENPELYPARVIAQHQHIYRILTETDEIYAVTAGRFNYQAESVSAEYPVAGDWVLVDRLSDSAGQAIIHSILPRRSAFVRQAPGGKGLQVVAANIDFVFICMALNEDYNLRRLERYLSIAWDSGALPVVVLTKADICEALDFKLREVEDIALGVDICITSWEDECGWQKVKSFLQPGKTGAFIGSSGVGKSTLLNRMLGEEVLRTKAIRNDGKGRHTTTHRELFLLPEGGMVIDTPGMREIQLAAADVDRAFTDISDLASSCRFYDCRHETEPGCAVQAAIADGVLDEARFISYQKLLRDQLYEERKTSMKASQIEKQKIIDAVGSLSGIKEILKHSRKQK